MSPAVLGVSLLFGIPIALAIVVVAILTNPDKADQWRKLLFRFVSWIYDGLSRSYAKASVEADTNQFLNSRLLSKIDDTAAVRLRLSWVEGASDARLSGDGNIIVRIRRERDQTRNKLYAFATAVPLIVFPRVRGHLDGHFARAIDLTIMRLLADLLGGHAVTIFHTEFLQPTLEGEPRQRDLLRMLQEVHQGGLFESVLLQELTYLGESIHQRLPGSDLPAEAREFAAWLRRLATRAARDESVGLNFVRNYFRVAFILASKSVTALMGTYPYERRLTTNLALGVESIYLQCLTRGQMPLTSEIAAKFDSDNRVLTRKKLMVQVHRDEGSVELPLYHFRRNSLYIGKGTFADKIHDLGTIVGGTVQGRVRDLLGHKVRVSVDMFDGEVLTHDLAWGYRGSPKRFLQPDMEEKFRILEIIEDAGLLRLGRKQLRRSPWNDGDPLTVGKTLSCEIVNVDPSGVLVVIPGCHPDCGTVYGFIPTTEWSWLDPAAPEYVSPQVGNSVSAEVVIADPNRDDIILSRRIVESSDWSVAVKKYPRGHSARAKVVRVDHEGLYCELEPGVYGRVPRHDVLKAGHELADFEQTVRPGAMYDVVIVRAKVVRRFFTLDLARNLPAPGTPRPSGSGPVRR